MAEGGKGERGGGVCVCVCRLIHPLRVWEVTTGMAISPASTLDCWQVVAKTHAVRQEGASGELLLGGGPVYDIVILAGASQLQA